MVAAISDFISFFIGVPFPPLQWLVDVGTAVVLFIILGWSWVLLLALLVETVPVIAMFPTWLLVVAVESARAGDEREKMKRQNVEVVGLPTLPAPSSSETQTPYMLIG